MPTFEQPKLTVYHARTNGEPGPIDVFPYTPTEEDLAIMGLALDAARNAAANGDSPIGAALVLPTHEILVEETREFRDDDLLGHAEMRLYSRAREIVGRDLSNCALYTIAEPCYGCCYPLDKGKIGRIVIAARREDVDFFTRKDAEMERLFKDSRRELTVVSGIRVAEAVELLKAENRKHWGD